MKGILFLILIFCALETNAQNYLISFAGTGESITVTSVNVENLTTGTTKTLSGDDILRLTMSTGVQLTESDPKAELTIYPNPMTDKSRLLISAPESGDAIISIYDITGRCLTHHKSRLDYSINEFSLSGLKMGIHIVNVKGNSYQYSGKLISHGQSNNTASIEKVSNNAVSNKAAENFLKGPSATIDMEYTSGDRLKFSGISGDYTTVISDIPEGDKTITFNFIACTDGDGNSYPVVEISSGTKGPQVWMAENLKTTTYSTGSTIPLVTDPTAWHDLTSPGYSWYNNDETINKDIHGALYNWFAVGAGDLCPTGWHVPSQEEWTTLADNIGGLDVAGGKLKESGLTH